MDKMMANAHLPARQTACWNGSGSKTEKTTSKVVFPGLDRERSRTPDFMCVSLVPQYKSRLDCVQVKKGKR
jgi:hypothetical protein